MPLALLALVAFADVTLKPTDDLWVYPHAGDPAKDAYLRVWGSEGVSVAKQVGDAEVLSYSFLRFDVTGLPTGTLKGAKLVLTSVAGPNYTEAQAKKSPLEVRPVEGGFAEKGWKYDLLERFMPSADPQAVYGTGFPSPWPAPDAEGTIGIDLLKGPGGFGKALAAARAAGKPLGLALTSALDVQSNPDVQTLYKVYSKEAPVEASRPKLILSFE